MPNPTPRRWGVIARLTLVAIALGAMNLAPSEAAARTVKIKLATVAPKGTAFFRIIEELGQEWKTLSDGQVQLKIYPGGIAGDEIEVVRKMRLGTLQGGLITAIGLSEIDRAVNAFGLPMAYSSPAALDFVRERMAPGLEALYAEKGFVILAWAEAGWVRFLSVKPIVVPADAHALKMYISAGFPEMVDVWRSGGFKPVPLPSTEITTGLQTGLIEAVPTTAQATMMMRWYTHARYLTDNPWAPLVGALVIDRKAWHAIDPALRVKLQAAARKAGARLRAQVRETDRKAVEEMKAKGLQVSRSDPAIIEQWREMVKGMSGKLRGALAPPAAYDEAMGHLADFAKMGGFTDGADE